MIKLENNIKGQIEQQNKLLEDTDNKFENILSFKEGIDKFHNIEYDFMDEMSKDDLENQVQMLEKVNDEQETQINDLKQQKLNKEQQLTQNKKKAKEMAQKVVKLEGDYVGHDVDKIERENELLSQKYV